MTEAAIIAGSLVDVRNVGTHKSVKLTIHVPEEHAMRVMQAFGWPTGVSPVSVAIARMDDSVQRPATLNAVVEAPRPLPPTPLAATAGAAKEPRKFGILSPAQQAGILCNERAFRLFLAEKFDMPLPDPDEAASVIRHHCKVSSRKELTTDNAGWSDIVLAYRLWQREPEVVG